MHVQKMLPLPSASITLSYIIDDANFKVEERRKRRGDPVRAEYFPQFFTPLTIAPPPVREISRYEKARA